jgi:glutamate-1-semialdehyde 2,1-aminomutase
LLLQTENFLQFLREECTANGTMLIFDEVISGFRVGFEGAAGLYGIQPDIITYGKIIGGGMPVGAYCASASIMRNISPEGPVYQAGTLSGNPVAMGAGIAQLTELLKPGFYEELKAKTTAFVEAIQQYVANKNYEFKIYQIGSIFWFAFTGQEYIRRADEIDASSMAHFKIFHRELLNRGVYLGPSGYEVGFVSSAHTTNDMEQAKLAIFDSLDMVFNQ